MTETNSLYPPILSGILPAFNKKNENVIRIPFGINKAVSNYSFGSIQIKIRDLSNNKEILYTSSSRVQLITPTTGIAIFEIKDLSVFVFGKKYKVQIAFNDGDGNTSKYMSTVGIIKCSAKPTLSISNLNSNSLNIAPEEYLVSYETDSADKSEKLYSAKIVIKDANDQVFYASNEEVYNHENDDYSFTTSMKFHVRKSFIENQVYTIQAFYTSINGFEGSSPIYRVVQQSTVAADTEILILPIVDQENGCVEINLAGKRNASGSETAINGSFLISRSSLKNNYGYWEPIHTFTLKGGQYLSDYIYKDLTVEFGDTYIYSIQQFNPDNDIRLYSNRYKSEPVYVTFDHSFLCGEDGRQLKIKYNPKVSSFKTNYLESKLDAIGGKYPLFFRNGNTEYKEFPVSGLISYMSDENEYFLKNENLGIDDEINVNRTNRAYEDKIFNAKPRTTNLVDYNINAEKIFKTEVLSFLTDGKPKLFRSPVEGNFIVRLMNSSLTPSDQVGRMLHTFNSTAIEIAECNYENLSKYNIVSIDETNYELTLQQKTVTFQSFKFSESTNNWIQVGPKRNIYSVSFVDMMPGDKIMVQWSEGEPSIITIGVTGSYNAKFDKPIIALYVHKDNQRKGQVTYSYYGRAFSLFETYSSIESADIPIKQIMGPTEAGKDILEDYNDERYQVTDYYALNFTKRNVVEIDIIEDKYYLANRNDNSSPLTEEYFSEANPVNVFKFKTEENECYYFSGDRIPFKHKELTNNVEISSAPELKNIVLFCEKFNGDDNTVFYGISNKNGANIDYTFPQYINGKVAIYRIKTEQGEFYYNCNGGKKITHINRETMLYAQAWWSLPDNRIIDNENMKLVELTYIIEKDNERILKIDNIEDFIIDDKDYYICYRVDSTELYYPCIKDSLTPFQIDFNKAKSEIDYTVKIDDNLISIEDSQDLWLSKLDYIPKISDIGIGVLLDASIQRRKINYSFENADNDHFKLLSNYQATLINTEDTVNNETALVTMDRKTARESKKILELYEKNYLAYIKQELENQKIRGLEGGVSSDK